MARGILRSRRRQRGAAFTMFVIVASVVLLVTATLFMGATRNTHAYSGFQSRRAQLQEAAFAGVQWAKADAVANAAAAEGSATLQLSGVDVEVRYWRRDGRVAVVSTAAGSLERAVVDAVLSHDDGRLKLVSYELSNLQALNLGD